MLKIIPILFLFSQASSINCEFISMSNLNNIYKIVAGIKDYDFAQYFNGSEISDDDVKCLEQWLLIKNGLNNFDRRAYELVDAWGKLPSGILAGNLNAFGSFQQCMDWQGLENSSFSASPTADDIHSQYCLSKIYLPQERSISFSNNLNNTFYISFTQSNLPISIKLGICIPATCSPKTTEFMLESVFKKMLNYSVNIDIDEAFCQIQNNKGKFGTGDSLAIIILLTVAGLIICSTTYDVVYFVKGEKKSNVFVSFSILTNGQKIFICNSKSAKEEMNCLHGIRVFLTIWIVYGHAHYVYLFAEAQNPTYILAWTQQYYSALIYTALLSVDTFLLLSGFLVTWNLLKQYHKTNKQVNIFLLYFHRFLRLTPLLAMGILLVTTLLNHVGDGPLWPKYTATQDNCVEYWWSALLYVQNYVNPTQMCYAITWYLSVDMQLFIISPILVYLLYRFKTKFIFVILVLVFISIGLTIGTYLKHNDLMGMWNPVRTAFVYLPTHIRMVPYLIGVIFGYVMFSLRGSNVLIPKPYISSGWILTIFIISSIFVVTYQLSQAMITGLEKAFYDVITRSTWSLAMCFVVFACIHGYAGPVNWFLSLPQWKPISRLSYAIYLVHFPIMQIFTLSIKQPVVFSQMNVILEFIGYYGLALFFALIASLAFESPVIALENIIFGKQKHRANQNGKIDKGAELSEPRKNHAC